MKNNPGHLASATPSGFGSTDTAGGEFLTFNEIMPMVRANFHTGFSYSRWLRFVAAGEFKSFTCNLCRRGGTPTRFYLWAEVKAFLDRSMVPTRPTPIAKERSKP